MKKLLYLLLFIASFGYSQEKYQKVRIFYNSKQELQQIIQENEIDHFNQKKGVYIECEIPKQYADNLKKSGKNIEILIADMQSFVKKNAEAKNPKNEACSSNFTFIDPINYQAGSMAGFLTFNECMAELDKMRTLFPNLITAKANVGTIATAGNRYLQFVKISDNPDTNENEKRILYNAMHHAREPGSMQQTIFFMWYLLENYAINPEIKYLVDNTEIFCIPIVNPDGYIHNQTTNPAGSGFWRKNRRPNNNGTFGVDNNRNYDYGWGTTGISLTNTSSDVYCGTAPFSEPENQMVKWFCEQKNFLVAMNVHTYSKLVLYPFGNEVDTPTIDDNIFRAISNEMVRYNRYTNQLSSELYPASGVSDDWMYGDVSTKPKIFAFTPEVGGSFWDSPAQTLVNNRNMLYTNLTALRFVHNYAVFTDKSDNFISTTNFNLGFSLKRLGLTENQNFTVTLVPTSTNILSVSAAQTFSNLSYGLDNANVFQVNLNTNLLQNEAVTFDVQVNNGNFIQTYKLKKYFGSQSIVINEPANSLSLWTSSVVNTWGTTTAAFVSSNTSITDSPNIDYLNNVATTLKLTNSVNLVNKLRAELTFYAKWDIEKGFDYAILEIQKNDGAWVPQCGLHTTIGTANQVNGKPLYDGIQNTWVQEKIDLSEYLNSNISIRFRFKSDDLGTADGFYFDDFKVTTINANPLSNIEFEFENIYVSPNPASTFLDLNSILDIENYKIFNISGQLLANEKLTIDKINVSNLSNGVYLLELSNANKRKVLKFVVQK